MDFVSARETQSICDGQEVQVVSRVEGCHSPCVD